MLLWRYAIGLLALHKMTVQYVWAKKKLCKRNILLTLKLEV